MYNFTKFAIELNEIEALTAPTDSRLRPDQRLMEEAEWDGANKLKVQLEEKQRAKRKENELKGIKESDHEPTWFEKKLDPTTNQLVYAYKNEYWSCKEKQRWDKCPNIFL
jgi:hypothetical protein